MTSSGHMFTAWPEENLVPLSILYIFITFSALVVFVHLNSTLLLIISVKEHKVFSVYFIIVMILTLPFHSEIIVFPGEMVNITIRLQPCFFFPTRVAP